MMCFCIVNNSKIKHHKSCGAQKHVNNSKYEHDNFEHAQSIVNKSKNRACECQVGPKYSKNQ